MIERAVRGLYWTGHHIATTALRASAGLTYLDHVVYAVGQRGEAICDVAGRLMDVFQAGGPGERRASRRCPLHGHYIARAAPGEPLIDCPKCSR